MRTSPLTRSAALAAAVIVALAGWLSPAVPSPVRAASALTALYVEGGWMASGRTVWQTAVGATWTATYDSSTGAASITIDTGDAAKNWSLTFAAPPGEQLAVDDYPSAVRYPFNGAGQPGLSVTHGYYGCSQVSGGFTVTDWQVSGTTITAFAVSFVHHCESDTDTSRGELRFASTAPLKAVVADVATLDFGNVVTGRQSATKSLILRARGNAPSTVSSVALGGTNGADYQLVSNTCTGVAMAPGANCAIGVRITPKDLGTRVATVTVSDDTFPGAHVVGLTAVGRAYAISPATLDFGTQALGTRGRLTTKLMAGLTPLSVTTDVQGSSEGFQLGANSACGSLAALGSCTVTVEFQPTIEGAHNDSAVTWTVIYGGNYEYPSTALKGMAVATSKVAWGADRTAGRAWSWSYGKALARTVSGTTTYLHVVESTDNIGGKWANNTSPKMGVYYVRTSNLGSTWTTSYRLNPSTQHGDRAAVAASGANVYAAWISQTKIGTSYSATAPRIVYLRTNTNHGASSAWKSAVRLTPTTGRVDYVAVAAYGSNVYVTFTDAATGNIRLAISRDKGATWKTTTLGVSTNGTSDGKAGYPAIGVSGARIIVSWSADDNLKILARMSTDSGAHWTTAATLATSAESETAAASSSDRFVVAWTGLDGARVRTYKAGAWGTTKSIKVSPTNPYPTHWTPAVALNGTGGTAVVWSACSSDCNKSVSTADLIWAESSDGGATFPYLQVLSSMDGATNWSPSVIWASATSRHVLYERDTESGYRMRIRTGTGAPK